MHFTAFMKAYTCHFQGMKRQLRPQCEKIASIGMKPTSNKMHKGKTLPAIKYCNLIAQFELDTIQMFHITTLASELIFSWITQVTWGIVTEQQC